MDGEIVSVASFRMPKIHAIHPPRRGIAMLWTVTILVVLTGFCSLAVDVARIQVARTELQRATIAAARAGAAALATDQASARSAARCVASQNPYDLNQTLTLTNSEIAFVNLSGKDGVRVTVKRTIPVLLAGILGTSNCDVSATATAVFTPGKSGWRYALAAREFVNMSGNIKVDGYDSSIGTYGGSNRSYGDIATGGNGNFSGNMNVTGTVYYTTTYTANGNMSGNSFVKPPPQPIPSEMMTKPPVYTNLGNVNGNTNMTLPAGVYYADNLNVSGNTTLTILGDVTIYVNGNVNMSGNMHVAGDKPASVKLVQLSSAGVNLSGNARIYGLIYAPNSPVNISGNLNFYGSIVCKQASLSGNLALHYDNSLGGGSSGAGGVTLVE